MTHRFTAAVVTGAGSGLGRQICLELARRGASVMASDVNEVGLAETVQMMQALGVKTASMVCDVRSPEQVASLAVAAEDALGPFDLWVNNAGVAVAGDVGDVPLEDWEWVLDINLRGVVFGAREATTRFKATGRGVVLNVASMAGLVSTPGMAPYNVAKSGVVALSQTMSSELRPLGIGVTVLCPSFFQTNLLDEARSPEKDRMNIGAKMMARAKITAADVARVALDDAAAGRLYSLPMMDGRVAWVMSRLMPSTFQRLVTAVTARLGAR